MKINWLWDSHLSEAEVRKIIKDENNPKFNIYVQKLFSRVNDPKIVFDIIDEITFLRKWPGIKKQMQKDRWLNNRLIFWQTIYERVLERFKKKGIKIRQFQSTAVSPEMEKIAQQIKDLRLNLGYTQKDLAEKLGVIQQYISKIENGHENISIDALKKVADALDKKLIVKFS